MFRVPRSLRLCFLQRVRAFEFSRSKWRSQTHAPFAQGAKSAAPPRATSKSEWQSTSPSTAAVVSSGFMQCQAQPNPILGGPLPRVGLPPVIQTKLRALLIPCLIMAFCCCQGPNRVEVREAREPVYPLDSRIKRIQGIVYVAVSIGDQGKVVSVRGTGADLLLVKSSEENASRWVWGPFPRNTQFPVAQTVIYDYKLEGNSTFVLTSPKVTMVLPGRVEIVASPVASDYQLTPIPAAGTHK
jgi:hypothetical protein